MSVTHSQLEAPPLNDDTSAVGANDREAETNQNWNPGSAQFQDCTWEMFEKIKDEGFQKIGIYRKEGLNGNSLSEIHKWWN